MDSKITLTYWQAGLLLALSGYAIGSLIAKLANALGL